MNQQHMVERVAREIVKFINSVTKGPVVSWDDASEDMRADMYKLSADLIKAMREPTRSMTAVADLKDYTEPMGLTDMVTREGATELWNDMIDVALNEVHFQ